MKTPALVALLALSASPALALTNGEKDRAVALTVMAETCGVPVNDTTFRAWTKGDASVDAFRVKFTANFTATHETRDPVNKKTVCDIAVRTVEKLGARFGLGVQW